MKISHFPNQTALNSMPIITAFLNSCRAQGWQIVENSLDADAVVIWSVLWAGRMRANQSVYEHYRKLNKPVFILEVGNLVRGTTWRVSVNNVNGSGIFGESVDTTRSNMLGVKLKHCDTQGNAILIACQRGDSLQWQGQPNVVSWVTNTIEKIRQYTDRAIVVRPHPRFSIGTIAGATIENPRAVIGSYDGWNLDYQQYHCVINHNSGPSVQAVINDVPVICDVSSLAAAMSNAYSEIENLQKRDRSKWFLNLCQTEYLVEEIATGMPLIKLQKALFSLPRGCIIV